MKIKNEDKNKAADLALWKKKPAKHDYPAAMDYLELLFCKKKVKFILNKLKKASIISKKAKDILRASKLPLLDISNIHVSDNIKKCKNGEKLSPVLLVRTKNGLVIADGYHRVCAIYCLSEDLNIPCKLV